MKKINERRALIVGIDRYKNKYYHRLTGCVADAKKMKELLEINEDGSPNYACRLLTDANPKQVTRAELRKAWRNLFREFSGQVLFFFSGHGGFSQVDNFLTTYDGIPGDPGLPMTEFLGIAALSQASEVLIILDCCYAGGIGNKLGSNIPGGLVLTELRQGITVLAASGAKQTSKELNGHGLFTSLVIGALSGGSADVRGYVSAASIYGYVEQALGPWDQRPLYKSYATTLSPIRRCKPTVPDEMLRDLPKLFKRPDARYRLDPTYEFTESKAVKSRVEIFRKFKLYRNAGLLRTVDDIDLFYAALDSRDIELTPLGQFYWRLVSKKLL